MTVKSRIVTLGAFLSMFGGAGIVMACGSDNLFEPLAKKDDKDKGKNALQDGNYDAAILSLEDHLAKNPDDVEARAMLANAYMGKAGIDQIKLAAKIAAAGGDDWSSIVSAMPEGNEDNVESLSKAVDTLSAIPAGERTPEQSYQLAMAQASLAVTITKKTAGDGNSVSDAKVATMSDADAGLAYATLAGSKQTVNGDATLAANAGAQKLASLSGRIDAEPGATNAEKMRSFLQKNN